VAALYVPRVAHVAAMVFAAALMHNVAAKFVAPLKARVARMASAYRNRTVAPVYAMPRKFAVAKVCAVEQMLSVAVRNAAPLGVNARTMYALQFPTVARSNAHWVRDAVGWESVVKMMQSVAVICAVQKVRNASTTKFVVHLTRSSAEIYAARQVASASRECALQTPIVEKSCARLETCAAMMPSAALQAACARTKCARSSMLSRQTDIFGNGILSSISFV